MLLWISVVHSLLLLSSICRNTSQFVYLITCYWTFWVLSCMRLLWVKLLWTFISKPFRGQVLSLLFGCGINQIAGSQDRYMFNLISNCQTVLQSANAVLYFHEPYLNSSFSPSSPAFTLISLFDLVIPVSVNEVIALCCFHLQFPDDWWRTSFNVLIGDLYIFCEVSIKIFCPLKFFSFCYWFVFILYIFWTQILYVKFLWLFLPFRDLPFHFLNGLFDKQRV